MAAESAAEIKASVSAVKPAAAVRVSETSKVAASYTPTPASAVSPGALPMLRGMPDAAAATQSARRENSAIFLLIAAFLLGLIMGKFVL